MKHKNVGIVIGYQSLTMDDKKKHLKPNPAEEANCLSKALFWWATRVLRLGHKRHLEDADLYDVLPEDSSIKLSNDLGRHWERELYKYKTGGRPSLFRALFRCYGPWVIAIGILFFVVELFRIAQAILLGIIISYLENVTFPLTTWSDAYLYAIGWALAYIFVTVLDNLGFHKSFYYGLKMRVACTSLLYRKVLKLSQYSLNDTSTSTIINLFSSDAHRFDQSCLGINYIWIAPLEICAVLGILWKYLRLGPTCLIGVALIAILTPVQYLIGRFLAKLRLQMSLLAERRVRIMNEIIQGIKTIKLNCWEKPFTSLISTVRKSEYAYLKAICHCRGFNAALYFVSGKLVMLGTFVTYILLGNYASASTIFTTLALYEILRSSVSLLMPWGIQYFSEAVSAVDRIEAFLLLEERNNLDSSSQLNLLNRSPLLDNIAVKFEDFTGSWTKDATSLTLEALNLTIQKGQFVIVTGPISSGKSSLLMSILGDLPRLGGFVRACGRVGYVPEQPWVFPGSVRENILFGVDMDRRRYNRVLFACGLIEDLDQFPQGDLATVGEKGISLTNGQKAKIGLARVIYGGCDVLLVDDVLAGMTDKDARFIFTKCFCGLIATKTILLVCHTLTYIKTADSILLLDQGKLTHNGCYEDLKNQGVNFPGLLSEYGAVPEPVAAHIIDTSKPKPEPGGLTQTMRQKLGLSNYSSEESLEQVWLEVEDASESDQLIDEDKEKTSVQTSIYLQYFSVGGGVCGLILFIVLCLFAQVSYILSDWWLYKWSITQREQDANSTRLPPPSETETFLEMHFYPITPVLNFYVYLTLVVSFFILGFLRASVFSVIAARTSRNLHERLFNAIIRAPLSFFEKSTVGRVLSRFARDLGYVDDALPASFFDCIQFLSLVVGALVVAAVANFWLVIVIIPLILVFIYARFYFIKTAREIRKLEVTAKTPIYQHLSNTLEGMWTIHACQSEDRFLRMFDAYQDRHTAAGYMYLAINRWFAIRLDSLSVLLVTLIAFVSIAVRGNVDSGLVGMAMAYALNLMGLFQYSIRQSAEVESQMTGVERILKFSSAKPEAEVVTATRPGAAWPQYGIVTFEGVTVHHAETGPRLLSNVWCCIRAEEKVGIIGPQEACKQALVSAILRLSEPSGIVRIDGQDISELGLHDLREKISVISQDPMLFGGSLRRNLDPFTRHPDAHLWKVLEEVQLKEKVDHLTGKMYAEMAEYGASFSLGERQLLCLARALLRQNKIIIYEESPSVIDKRLENVIFHILRTKFSHCTVIYFAQKLLSIIDYDRTMVLEEGKIKEFDPPHILLQNKNGQFYKMAEKLPEEELTELRLLAKDKHENKPYKPPPQSLNGEAVVPPSNKHTRPFLPSFQSTRITGVLSNFSGNRFSTNRF